MDLTARFPDECLEDIFRHLSFKDLLKCTAVSPSWNEFIGTARSCTERVKLMLGNLVLDENIKKVLSQSGRKWRFITASNLGFENVSLLLDFLRFVQPSVERLCFHPGYVNGGFDEHHDILRSESTVSVSE